VREVLKTEMVFSKVARWRQDKGWKPAVQAIHNLNTLGEGSKLLAHVGMESERQKIAQQVMSLGMVMKNIHPEGDSKESCSCAAFEKDFTPYFEALSGSGTADVFNFAFPVPLSFLRVLYQASDVVLADSDHDPFGLVGMEAMAAGAIVFTSRRAEGHAKHMCNAIVLDKYTAEEIQFYAGYLHMHPEKREMIKTSARQTAERWTWKEVVKRLLCELEHQASIQGIDLPV
ncbi:MAG: glycosyltransferase, partial [Desulfatiglandales bacterium]